MNEIPGIILILSCKKYINNRIKEIKLKKEYLNWKVIYVIGDMNLTKDYEIRQENFLYIKCEDSYLHLIKKFGLSLKYILDNYKLTEGILRCCDDLIFNEKILFRFLQNKKYDFYGQSDFKNQIFVPNFEKIKKQKQIIGYMITIKII